MSIFKKKATEPKKAAAKKTEPKKAEASKAVAPVAPRATGQAYRILIHPIVTEKFSGQGTTYAFAVAPKANKLEIKQAIQDAYGVKVAAVRVMNVPGKSVRSARGNGRRADWRKAIIALHAGQSIDLFVKNS